MKEPLERARATPRKKLTEAPIAERKTARIFLSYVREDKEKVKNLYQKLSDEGFDPWMDEEDLLPGERWQSRIQKAIRRSHFFLVCLSANSIDERGWIQWEMRQALDIWGKMLDSDIYLIPVRLEDCEVPEKLRDFQWVDLFEEDGWTRLVKAIKVAMERRGEAIESIVQESTPLEPSPTHEKLSLVIETATPEEDPEQVQRGIKFIEKGEVLLGKYEILRPLGSGALGDVYLAEDMVLERKVAVKHLKPEYASDEETLKRFQEEASKIAKLRHPNIAIVHGLEQGDGQSYVIMEYAEEGTLADFLAEKGPLSITQAIDLTIALCHALADVHRQGIFHRDIKPGNVLLIKLEGKIVPRLADFGLSVAPKSGFYSHFATLQYASPEQLCGEPVDARSDIYSLGMTLYEMLTGRVPFFGSADEVLRAQLEQEPPSPRSARKGILPSLEKVILEALSKEPEGRYETTQEMAEDLEIARQEELEKEEQVRNLYTQADQYMHGQNWPMAVEILKAISVLDPDYKDTDKLLVEAQEQMALKIKYEQGLAALGRQDWSEAEERFKEVIRIDKTYEDAAARLEEAENQIHLLSLYTEATQLEEMEEWPEAIQKYAEIISIYSGYRDARQRLVKAGEKDTLQLLYNQARDLCDKKNWQEAAEKFRGVLALDPQYKDAASKAEEAEKHARSQTLYAEGIECLNSGEWQRAIAKFEEIRGSDPGYEDVDARFAEAERRKRWQDLFDEGMARRGRKDWQGAIEKFTQLLSENPEHPTAATLLEEAKQRQTQEKTKVKWSEESRLKAWWLSQDPAVKAALIGVAATILVALCGLLGGDTALEVARLLWMKPTPTVPTPTAASTSTLVPTFSPTPTSILYPTLALVSTALPSTSTATPIWTPTSTATLAPTNTPTPTATLTPTATPTNTPTPTPMHTPTPTETPTSVLLPPPIPLGPENGAAFLGEPVLLRWGWYGPRASDEVFSVRVRREGETKPCHHAQAKDLEWRGSLSYCTAGTHYWSVALVRDLAPWLPEDDENRWQNLSEPSAEWWFYYAPGGDDDGDDGTGRSPARP